jgi:ParB-like chromosome segregation protein Spo0J
MGLATITPDVSVSELDFDDIFVPKDMRPVDAAAVDQLVDSINTLGLQGGGLIYVRWAPAASAQRAILVAGRHRFEAFRRLGWARIPCIIFDGTAVEAKLWRIAENLMRLELTALERADAIAAWAGERAHLAQVSSGGKGHKGGISAAARELGVDRRMVQRGLRISGLATEAKTVAVRLDLAGDQSALLTAAHAGGASEQIASLHQTVERRQAAQARRKRESERLKHVTVQDAIDEVRRIAGAPIGDPAQLRFGVGWEGMGRTLEELATKLETDDPASVVGHFAPGRLQQIAAAVEKLPALLDRLKLELEKRIAAREKPPGPTVH